MLDPIRLSSVHVPNASNRDDRQRSSSSELELEDGEEKHEGQVMFHSASAGHSGNNEDDWEMNHLSQYEALFVPAFLFSNPNTIPPSSCVDPRFHRLSVVPRPPKSNQLPSIRFFINYHQREILPSHYFKWYDLHYFCKGWLPAMAEQSDALRDAMVSFSALIYSIKTNGAARYVAFYYYAEALKKLHILLSENAMTPMECNVAIATALQLSTIDVIPY